MRLIDADASTAYIERAIPEWSEDKEIALDCLMNSPTIDAVPLSAVRKAAKKLAYIHQQIDLYGDRPDLHEEEYWLEYLMDEEWKGTRNGKTMRLIDADTLMAVVEGNPLTTDILKEYVRATVREQPTVDAEPVRRGMWTFIRLTDKDYGHKAKECSSCGSTFFDTKQWNYCPNCGARMDKYD